jgi:integrase
MEDRELDESRVHVTRWPSQRSDSDALARELRPWSHSDSAGDDDTLGAFLEEWLRSIEHSVRPRTWRRYAEYVRIHITPTLGQVNLGSLHAKHLQLLYAERMRAGLSATSIRHLHRTLHGALSQAQQWGLINANVTSHVNLPRGEPLEVQPLSPQEAEKFLIAVRGNRFEALYTLAITTGMRQGELLGLRWRDVDLERRSIRVTGSLQYIPGRGLQISHPKTRKSRRHVLLTEVALGALRRHLVAQNAERSRRGARWQELDFVFASRDGRPLYATNVIGSSLPRILRSAGLRKIRFHDLRHTTATLLLGQGVHPKIVSEMLGHSSIGITLDLYSHATPTMQETATTALDQLLGPSR